MRWKQDNQAWERILRYSAYDYNLEFTDDEEKDLRNLRKDFFHGSHKKSNYKMMKREVVGSRIRRNKALLHEYMNKHGLSERQFSKFLGVANPTLRSWMKEGLPSEESAEKVFDVCGIRLNTWQDARSEIYTMM